MSRLKELPVEIVEKMLENQVLQGNKRDATVFEKLLSTGYSDGGFTWERSPEGFEFWSDIINYKKYDVFFKKYPKKDLALPRVVEVKNSLSDEWRKRVLVFVRKINNTNYYYCVNDATTLEKSNSIAGISLWREMREVKEPVITELTLSEIATKLNIPVNQLRIKE